MLQKTKKTFKPGDKVTVLPYEVLKILAYKIFDGGSLYFKFEENSQDTFLKEMSHLCDTVVTLKQSLYIGAFRIKEAGWNWYPEWFIEYYEPELKLEILKVLYGI